MSTESPVEAQAPITTFYDGGCPLCQRQVDWLAHHPRRHSIHFIDIRAKGFDPAPWGRTCHELMGRMYALDGQGRWFSGMDAIRALYAVLGYRWQVRISSLPGLKSGFDRLYLAVARRRNRLGRWLR